ncbi:MAG TPA: hypothetical protein VFV68_03185 [Agriterribacter sp.]|nr:hypothetical protein [Agriterribacter sp.]
MAEAIFGDEGKRRNAIAGVIQLCTKKCTNPKVDAFLDKYI